MWGKYKDNGLAAFKNKSGPESEKIKKSIQSLFREKELKIKIQCNLKTADYLYLVFNLTDSSYRSFIINRTTLLPSLNSYLIYLLKDV